MGAQLRHLFCVFLLATVAVAGCSSGDGRRDSGAIRDAAESPANIADAGAEPGETLADGTLTDGPVDTSPGGPGDANPGDATSADALGGDSPRADVTTGDGSRGDATSGDLPLADSARTDVAAGDAPDSRAGDAVLVDAVPIDTGPEVCPWGDQQVHQTAYGLATTLRICLVSTTASKLRYRVTTPSTPAGGGYVVVSFRKVPSSIQIDARIVPAQVQYPLDTSAQADFAGHDFDTWFAAAAGSSFFLDVSNAYSSFATISQTFDMSATFVPVDDPYEPNDSSATAASISVGTPLTASPFAGYTSSSSTPMLDMADYYKVTLPAGIVRVTLTGAVVGHSLSLTLDDPRSQSFSFAAYGATGSDGSVTISPGGPVAAGDYYVFVEADYAYSGYGKGTAPPTYLTQPYTLLVTSEPALDAGPPEVGSDGPKRDIVVYDVNPTEVVDNGWIWVSAGTNYACGVRANHTVACWGIDNAGQASPPDGSFISVSAGSTHTCGLRTDGTVACWGDNTFGQATPPPDKFLSVDVGERESCGVKADGTAACWGYNSFGQSTPPDGAFTSTSSGGDSTCGLRPDATAACWGYTGYGETSPPGGTFVSLSVGYGHACGVRPDGSLSCWGFSGSNGYSPPPGVYVAVADGSTHTCGIMDSGAVACWGHNDAGDVVPPSGTFITISSGYYLSCGIRSDGTIACWGDNRYGQATTPG
jgi:hypothetical protein